MSDDKKCPLKDVITLGPDLGNGHRLAVRHDADHQLGVGAVRLLKEGEAIQGEALVLKRNSDTEFEVIGNVSSATHPGPAKVTTTAYRDGWDNLFGNKQTVGQA